MPPVHLPFLSSRPQDTLLIIVWRPNVISVIDGNIPMMYAIFRSVADNCPINPLFQPETHDTYGGTYSKDNDLNILVDDEWKAKKCQVRDLNIQEG